MESMYVCIHLGACACVLLCINNMFNSIVYGYWCVHESAEECLLNFVHLFEQVYKCRFVIKTVIKAMYLGIWKEVLSKRKISHNSYYRQNIIMTLTT